MISSSFIFSLYSVRLSARTQALPRGGRFRDGPLRPARRRAAPPAQARPALLLRPDGAGGRLRHGHDVHGAQGGAG